MRTPLTLDDYFNARMIAEPFCLFDFCLECDGSVAVVTTSVERAEDLRHPPVYVTATAHGGHGRWGQAITWMGMPDEIFALAMGREWYIVDAPPADLPALFTELFTPLH